jgi:cyclase
MRLKTLALATIMTFATTGVVQAQDVFEKTTIKVDKLNGSVAMLTGMGGNIGVSAGDDGILIIDDQFAPLAEKIAKALDGMGDKPVKYLVNTHYHGDHTGSNAYFTEVKSSTIFAHDNVRTRLAADEKVSASALPVVTYAEGITFHFNNDTIKVMHLPAGHTDSDSVIWFEQANVMHAGDLFFEGRFPYIDLDGGGTIAGYIANVKQLISMVNDDTQIIPGHGSLSSKADYELVLNMLTETADFVKSKKAMGVSLQDLISAGLDKKWQAWSWEFINEEKWISTLYKGQ